MDLKQLESELNYLKENYHSVKNSINIKRQEIALALCPLKEGDRITVVLNSGKAYSFKVDAIRYFVGTTDKFGMEPNTKASWEAEGYRYTVTGELNKKWRGEVNGVYFLQDGKTFTEKDKNSCFQLLDWYKK